MRQLVLGAFFFWILTQRLRLAAELEGQSDYLAAGATAATLSAALAKGLAG